MTGKTLNVGDDRNAWTIDEAAQAMRVSPSTIWRAVKAGRIRAYRLGRRVLFRPDDLRADVFGRGPKSETAPSAE